MLTRVTHGMLLSAIDLSVKARDVFPRCERLPLPAQGRSQIICRWLQSQFSGTGRAPLQKGVGYLRARRDAFAQERAVFACAAHGLCPNISWRIATHGALLTVS